jgi:hypothetical protein
MTILQTIFTRTAAFLRTVASAQAAAAAVENGHRPLPSDLRRLGIDVAAFGSVMRG